jgi:hypothetical protein
LELKDNPLLQREDFNAGYTENVEKLKNNPEIVALDRLCYELFVMNEMGREFMKVVVDRYVIPPMADRNSPNFSTSAVWAEGFKDAIRMFRHAALSHEQRIKAETNK